MPGHKKPESRKTITVRIDGALVERARIFSRNEAGKPLFLTMNKLISQALEREIDRLELVLSGALPLERDQRPHAHSAAVDLDNVAATRPPSRCTSRR
jgi:hypothetical protein